jgi:AmmeMemoRadiSam system protein A
MDGSLTTIEKSTLLRVARNAIENQIHRKPLERFDIDGLTPNLSSPGASFVTLNTIPDNHLRGCIGTLEAYQSLILDVQEHAIAAAFDDYRFSPVRVSELPLIRIEVSRLTKPILLIYDATEDLLRKLRPGIDGVILKNGFQHATFSPQVWEKIESKESFLRQLCLKMGADGDLWKRKQLQVFTYQVEEFHE